MLTLAGPFGSMDPRPHKAVAVFLGVALGDTVSGSVRGLDPPRETRVAAGGMFVLRALRAAQAVLRRKT